MNLSVNHSYYECVWPWVKTLNCETAVLSLSREKNHCATRPSSDNIFQKTIFSPTSSFTLHFPPPFLFSIFLSLSFPFFIPSLFQPFPFSTFPFFNLSLLQPFPFSTFPFFNFSLLHPFPSSTFPFFNLSLDEREKEEKDGHGRRCWSGGERETRARTMGEIFNR